MKPKKNYFAESRVAGRQYYDCDEVFEELKVGTILRLEYDESNKYDPHAVQIIYETKEEEYILGYLPRGENEIIANILDAGWTDLFECRISRINPDKHYEDQIRVTIRINRAKK